jgi:hypothetical protein
VTFSNKNLENIFSVDQLCNQCLKVLQRERK